MFGSTARALRFPLSDHLRQVSLFSRDPLHQKARQFLLMSTNYKTKNARFREHDELRYALRSAQIATSTWPNSTWHLITADVAAPTASGNDRRLGLVPQWLNINYDRPDAKTQPPIRLQHGAFYLHLTFHGTHASHSRHSTVSLHWETRRHHTCCERNRVAQ
jgi:hypothetical protein